MSVMDGSRLLDDAGLSGAALHRNKQLINYVRVLLAQQDVDGFAELMHLFTDLVDDGGPLAFLRFDAALFDRQVRGHMAEAPQGDPEALCDYLHGRCIESLAKPPFIKSFRHELRVFLELPFPPKEDRLAACAALLTTASRPGSHDLSCQELPALYAIFRVQLIAWFAGTPEGHVAAALGSSRA